MRNIIIFIALLFTAKTSFTQIDLPAIGRQYEKDIQNTVYGKNPKAGKYYNIRGFKMYCEVYGKGEPLLLIHGNGANISAFVKQVPYLSARYKVIIADSRAHGKSADKPDSLTYEMIADDYAELLAQMNIDSVNVIGWSDGGINALLLAARHPGTVKKMVITGANLRPDSTAVAPDVLARITKNYNWFMDYFKNNTKKTALDSTVLKYKKLLAEQPHISYEQLSKITIPVLVVGGDNDVIRPQHTLEIFEHLPNAYLWILPNSGHSTLVVYADEFNKKAVEFFRSPFRKIEDRAREF